MTLEYEEYALLLALESNVFIPMTELSKILGISRITAKKRVDQLKERGIIKNPVAIYNPSGLGLERISVIAFVESRNSLEMLETVCDEHPYTHYRVRTFGGNFGLFIQFDIPIGSLNMLKEFLEKIKTEGIIKKYHVFISKGIRIEIFPDLSRFNIERFTWDFSWRNWFNQISEHSSVLPSLVNPKIVYSSFNSSHFKILRLLTSNASLKQSDIGKKLKLSRSEIYRQFNYVMNNYIDTIRFIYDRKILGLIETYIVFGHDVESDISAQIYHAIHENPPPFHLALDLANENDIHLWANMNMAQATDFAFSVWEKLKKICIYTLDTKNSELYWFYPNNFDFDIRQWRVSRNYMVNDPLNRTYNKLRVDL